jgi:hypothetical protein
MASFSIEEILGLSKDNNSSSNSNSEDSGIFAAAAKNSEQDANNTPRVAGTGTEPEADHEDVDVETVDEENAAEYEPVTVEAEVPASPPASSIIRGGRASRKRKRSQQADEEPSDGKSSKLNLMAET